MAIRIICDSGSDIVNPTDKRLVVLPLSITFGDTTYADGIDIDADRFYELLETSDELPKTSQVTPYAWHEAFQKAHDAGDECVAICLSSGLSGTYQSALSAAQDFADSVYVVDSQTVSMAERILVEYALRRLDEGVSSAKALAEELEMQKHKTHIVALLDTLEYLYKGGRISKVAANLGSALKIKPVISAKHGKVELIGKARGPKNGRNLLRKEIEKAGGINFHMPIGLAYSGSDDTLLQKYIESEKDLWEGHIDELPQYRLGGTVGTYAGPGTIVVGFFKND